MFGKQHPTPNGKIPGNLAVKRRLFKPHPDLLNRQSIMPRLRRDIVIPLIDPPRRAAAGSQPLPNLATGSKIDQNGQATRVDEDVGRVDIVVRQSDRVQMSYRRPQGRYEGISVDGTTHVLEVVVEVVGVPLEHEARDAAPADAAAWNLTRPGWGGC
jgi:hypothetical protein